MKKSILALLLLAAMLLQLVSCRGDTEIQHETDTSVPAETETETETETELTHNLPDLNFEGAAFRYMTRDPQDLTWIHPQLDADELNGEVLNDALYNTNRLIEAEFNFIFECTYMDGKIVRGLSNSIKSGDAAFEFVQNTDREAMTVAQEGLLFSMQSLDYIDLNQPWWSQFMNDNLTVKGKTFFAYGDYNLSTFDFSHILVFNKDMYTEHNLESTHGSMYDVVSSGEWDFDKYREMTETVTADTNGDGVVGKEDTLGLSCAYKAVLPGFWIGAGVQSVVKNEEDIPVYDLPSNAAFEQVVSDIFTITWDNNSWIGDPKIGDDMFIQGKILFQDTSFNSIANLRDMEDDFGIIPYPKHTTDQEHYYSRVEGGLFTMIPITNQKLEMTGALLEAMAFYAHRDVIPQYYEVALKTRTARDAESADMLDIIFYGRIYDWGDTIFCNILRDGIFADMMEENNREYVSRTTSVQKKMETSIQSIVKAFEEIG